MRRIIRHAKYQALINELAKKHPDLPAELDSFEHSLADDPHWPASIYMPAPDCWWSHFITDNESTPHLRVFHVYDDEKIQFLTIMPMNFP